MAAIHERVLERLRTLPPAGRMAFAALTVVAIAALALAMRGIWLGPVRVEPPAPTVREDVEAAPLPPSYLTTPIRVDLEPLVDALESAVPLRWGSLDERHALEDNDRVEVAFELERGRFHATFEADVARLTATVRYRVRAWYDAPVLPAVSASCGTDDQDEPPRLTVTMEAPLTLTPEWRLSGQTRIVRIVPATDEERDRCRVTPLAIDMTERVVRGAHDALASRTDAIDQALAGVDVRSRFERWWARLAEPVELDTDVWLVMEPEALVRGDIVGRGDAIEVPLTLTARPRFVLGSRPDVPTPPLPALAVGDVRPGLRIVAEGRAEYGAASRRLTKELRGRTVSAGGRSVRVRGVEVSGIGQGRVAVAVRVTGDLRGVLWLVGTPAWDATTGHVAVPDLDFDVATADVVLEGASWLARAGFVGFIREQARWPAAPAVAWLRTQLERGLNRRLSDELLVQGSAGDVSILAVRATRDALLVRASAAAVATLVVADREG